MPLPVTPSYERRLRDLRTLSPDTGALLERIALELQPQVLATSIEALEAQLLDHLQEVAEQQTRCVTRLWDWLNAVVSAGALTTAFNQSQSRVTQRVCCSATSCR
ncbi:hypothetical protein, partial [Pseudomonas fragi]|uniref:hypothetical protein n=1 Tax=Pseudomonas fragi TaxID=296 RepID=UPI0020CFA805